MRSSVKISAPDIPMTSGKATEIGEWVSNVLGEERASRAEVKISFFAGYSGADFKVQVSTPGGWSRAKYTGEAESPFMDVAIKAALWNVLRAIATDPSLL